MEKKRLFSFDLFKLIGVFFVFFQHCVFFSCYKHDIAERMLEIILMSSGFLAIRNNFDKFNNCTWRDSWSHTIKHIKKIYPTYVIALAISFVLTCIQQRPTLTDLISSVLSLTLLQAWSSNAQCVFAFNAAAWYLGVYAFCSFMTPVSIQTVKSCKRTWLPFVVAVTLRFMLSYLRMRHNFFSFNDHAFPVLRYTEFVIGMSLYPIFLRISGYLRNLKQKEIVTYAFKITAGILAIVPVFIDKAWMTRPLWILFTTPFILAIPLDGGILERIGEWKPLQMLYKYQMEFFLCHFPAITAVSMILHTNNRLLYIAVSFAAAAVLSVAINRLNRIFWKFVKERRERNAGRRSN